MALPSSGTMKASMIREELKETGTWSINAKSSRDLAKVPSGMIKFSDFYGKSSAILSSYIIPGYSIGNEIGYAENDFGEIGLDKFVCRDGYTYQITQMYVWINGTLSMDITNLDGNSYPENIDLILNGYIFKVQASSESSNSVYYTDTSNKYDQMDVVGSKVGEKVPYSIISCSGTYGGGK